MSAPYEGVPFDESQRQLGEDNLVDTIRTWSNSKILGTGLSVAKNAYENVRKFATEGNSSLRFIGMGASGGLFLIGFLGMVSML